MLLVAAYHFWFGRVSGGVDVFLLISAFLMAGSFTRKIENDTFAGSETLIKYWLHVFKRILPLATLTVGLILVATHLMMPPERWLTLLDEAKSVMLYRENWWSIKHMVDYYAADSSLASPFRHFWSLSLQGQIYFLWPLIFLVAWLPIKYLRLPARPLLAVVFGLIFVGSLWYSVRETALHQQTAYYNTYARLWEFALGTLAAIVLSMITLPAVVRAVMGWLGIAMIISCGFVLDVQGQFPGYAALWPTLAAVFIIAAGDTGTQWGPEKLLTLPPLLKLGNISYALYLVHWPILVFYLNWVKQEKAGPLAGVVMLAASIVIAWVMTKFVETPLRSWRWTNTYSLPALGMILACLVMILAPVNYWANDIHQTVQQAQNQRGLNNEGAKTLEAGYVYRGAEDPVLIPVRTQATDWADMGPLCTETNPEWSLDAEQQANCHHTKVTEHPTRTVGAVGNSHIQMWAPALQTTAEANGWDLVMMTHGGCFFAPEDVRDDEFYDDCMTAADSQAKLIEQLDPDLVILNGTISAAGEQDRVTPGIEKRVAELTDAGREVIGIRDTPRMVTQHKECLDKLGTVATCGQPAGQDVHHDPQLELQQKYAGFSAVNMSDVVCPDNECPVVIGNVYVYQDYDHITATYVATTVDFMNQRMQQALKQVKTHSS